MTQANYTQAQPEYYGTVLRSGSYGPDVALVQSWLNGVGGSCEPAAITVDGHYGPATEGRVKEFQQRNGLTADGKVGQNTWNVLYEAYAQYMGQGEIYPGIPTRSGNSGAVVKSMQQKLDDLEKVYAAIPKITADGKFGSATSEALRIFQRLFALSTDAVMGKQTFTALMAAWQAQQAGTPAPVPAPYGGTVLVKGDSGDSVRIFQSFLGDVTVDGKFGSATEEAVRIFQSGAGLTDDGKVGTNTWTAMRQNYNSNL